MRKMVLSLVAAGAALAAATPAAAQHYPQGYGSGYNGSGYNGRGYNNHGVGSLQARIDGVQRQIENLRARRMISRDEAEGLRHESRELERRLYRLGNYGLNGREAQDIQYRLARLEQHVQHEVRDGRGWNRY